MLKIKKILKTSLNVTYLILIFSNIVLSNSNIPKVGYIVTKDVTITKATAIEKKGENLSFETNGLPGFVKISQVVEILTEEQFNKRITKADKLDIPTNNQNIITDGRSIKQTLIDESFSGSEKQSSLILELIQNNPNLEDYQVIKEESGEVSIFGCNLKKDVILRIHQRTDGHGTQEMWNGSVLFRLKNAANGGSLNQTPSGKLPGSFQTF